MKIFNPTVILILINFFNSINCRNIANESRFEVEYQWNYINYTWETPEEYQNVIETESYIPINNAMVGIKYYKEKFYIATPRIRAGVPATLGYISTGSPNIDPLITPFPSWELNDRSDCSNLQSVQSMEIDSNGIMWVIDGLRIKEFSHCPTKLVLFDLNNNNDIIHTYEFPEHICLSNGGFLNDIVVDGEFAYITDNSGIDPGLIIYSLKQNHSWKIRDVSMFAEISASNFEVGGHPENGLSVVDGIALSPPITGKTQYLYYCALTALKLYAINTEILQDEEQCRGSTWRTQVKLIGEKQAQSDGMVVDNLGNLYYGLLPLYGVGTWNINEPFSKARIVDENKDIMVWTDSFAFDDKGYLYLLANNVNKFFDSSFDLTTMEGAKFRIVKIYTGTNSYLYTNT